MAKTLRLAESATRTFARLRDDEVVELLLEQDDFEKDMGSEFAALCVDVTGLDPPVQIGWVQDKSGKIVPAPPVVLPRDRQAANALADGLAVNYTGHTSLNGTYVGIGPGWDNMLHTVQHIGAFSEFPESDSMLAWTAKSGAITFSTTAEFMAVAKAVSSWISAWRRYVDGLAADPPANSTTIS